MDHSRNKEIQCGWSTKSREKREMCALRYVFKVRLVGLGEKDEGIIETHSGWYLSITK